jgi:hydrogenase maturation protein HypF
MSLKTIKIKISGVVQGVGFRPFVYRVAKKLNLKGSVSNTSEGVIIYINADEKKLNDFINIIKSEKPSNSIIKSIKIEYVEQREFNDFIIEKSLEGKSNDALIPVDLKICDDCIKDIFDFKERRFLYPFTNCTNCGPRFSIIKKIPYDRKYTTMKKFKMCVDCKKEYENPLDRRFHAQPNACIKCGPKVWVVTSMEI